MAFYTTASAQLKCYFEHFGIEEGLPQQTIMDILQDKRDFLWFSTWDGLCKFDGYDFTTYKIQPGDKYHMKSNRIDHIYEDKYGYIWTLSYDREAHRFDPKSEAFMSVRSLKEYENLNFSTSQIITTKSGKTWLLSKNSGCICVKDSLFDVSTFNVENGKLKGNRIFTVYEDAQQNTWILTNNGIITLSPDIKKLNYYFAERKIEEGDLSQSFFSILEQNNLIWFGSNNGRIWQYMKASGQFELLTLPSVSKVIEIRRVSDHKILFCTESDGFYIYNLTDKKFTGYNMGNLPNMPSNRVLSSYVDRTGNIWFELDCFGVSRFNTETATMTHFTPKMESAISSVFQPNFFVFEDKDNRLWVHPRGGGFSYYDALRNSLIPFYNEPFSINWRFSNMLHSAFSDKQGNLWLGTRSSGLEKVVFDDGSFKNITIDAETHSTVSNDVRFIFEDKDFNTWISTKGGKTYIYKSDFVKMGYLSTDGSISSTASPLKGVTYSMMQDNDGNIWIGTKGEGVYKATKESERKYRLENFKYNPNDIYSLSDNNVYSILQDKKGRIWIGTYGGGLNMIDNHNSIRFINHRNNLKKYPIETGSQIRILSTDKTGNILVGTTVGLIVFSSVFDSPEKVDFRTYQRMPNDDNSISGNDIFDICTTKNGETYLASFGSGLNHITETDAKGFPVKFKTYTSKNGLPSDILLTIVEDADNMLWISTEGNLTKFNPKTETFETFSEIKRLINGKTFSEASRSVIHTGEVLIGYSKGLVCFNPGEVKKNTYNPYIALVGFKLFNKDVPVGDNSPLTANIDALDKLVLKHDQNFFSIEFAALDYVEPRNIQYAYKLEGFDPDWIYCQNQRVANYTNLSKGEYVFKVKATNSDGVWSNNEHTLLIVVKPSFWETPWAYICYVILIIAIVYISLRILFNYYRMKDKVELEHKQTEMKARFFTDISHEIRTPLTMIVSPIDNMLHDSETPEGIKKQLKLVSKNTQRMLDMVNQVLDFRKIRQTDLNVQETEIGRLVEDVCNNFLKTAELQNINFTMNNTIGNEKIWIDRKCVEKIVFNLLSNAFKYTPANKTIKVNVFSKGNSIGVQVLDEGIGMSKNIQSRLFKRFESFNEDKTKPSTGIGLSMVKELVDKHNAKIQVESISNQGSSFTVYFMKGISHFGKDVKFVHDKTELVLQSPVDEITDLPENDDAQAEEHIEENATVLIVEDDTDLRKFIRAILEDTYTVYEAENGKEGLEKARNLIPDLIVSDIMMPEMDGMEFLKEIRSNINTSHILFILLTAKTTIDSQLEGLEFGADEYITKPFNVPLLKVRIKNLLERRHSLQSYYQKFVSFNLGTEQGDEADVGFESDKIISPPATISPRDQEFMATTISIIEKNIDNSDFIVEDLAQELGMSRTVFFKKIKNLTGMAPIEFIKDIIIQHAAQLLATSDHSVKEITYMLGYSDPKYFSKCFKKKYGVSPSEYKKEQQGD